MVEWGFCEGWKRIVFEPWLPLQWTPRLCGGFQPRPHVRTYLYLLYLNIYYRIGTLI